MHPFFRHENTESVAEPERLMRAASGRCNSCLPLELRAVAPASNCERIRGEQLTDAEITKN